MAGLKPILRLSGALAAAIVALLAPAQAGAANGYFKNSSIASVAERSSDGSPGGQCMAFVRETLRTVSSGRVRTSAYTHGYQGTFKANGGTLIANRDAAVRGDIIQVTPARTSDSWKGPERLPLHTAIVRRNLKGGNFAVIDSNYRYDEKVRRHDFNPYAMAKRYGGGVVKIWRLGSVPAPKPEKPKPKAKPAPKPTAPAPPGIGDSTGYWEPGPRGWHLSNALMPGPSNYIFARGAEGSTPVVGDWNGDGRDSTGYYEPGPRGWHLRDELNPGPSQYIFARGAEGSIPVVGDWNGDGRDSTGAYYPWDQTWHLRNELSAGPSQYIFKRGRPNAIPVVGDWDGDGRDSTGLYFPWDRSWHLRNELNAGPSQYAFVRGQPNAIPVVGDWNGDGRDSTGLYFPWDRSWHLRNELDPGPSQYAFARAAAGSIPVVGNWDGL